MGARGGWLVLAVALALIALVAGALWLSQAPRKSGAASPNAPSEPAPAVSAEPTLEVGSAAAISAPRSATNAGRGALARPARACGSIELAVVDVANGERPGIGIVFAVVARDLHAVPHLEWSEPSDASGIARLSCVAPGALQLISNRTCDGAVAVVEAGQTTKLRTSCGVPCPLRGRVLDLAGRSAGNVELRLVLAADCGPIDLWLGECDNAGRFEVAAPESGHVYARGREHAPATLLALAPCASNAPREIELRVQAGAAVLLVQVLAGDDQPVPDAVVRVEPALQGGVESPTTPRAIWSERTDAEGRVTLRGLAAGPHLVRARAHGFAAWTARVELDGRTRRDELARLQPGGVIAGRVTSDDGSPASSVAVRVGDDECDFGFIHAITAKDGSFRIADVPAGVVNVRVLGDEGASADARLNIAPDETTDWNAQLSRQGN